MERYEDTPAVGPHGHPPHGFPVMTRTPRATVLTLTALLTLPVALGMARPDLVPSPVPWPFRAPCASVPLEIVSAPEIQPALARIVQPLQNRSLGEDACLQVSVRGQDPATVLAGARILPQDRWPDLWIPDSPLWPARATSFRSRLTGTVASSPLVLAGQQGTLTSLGWTTSPPTWPRALDGTRTIAVSDLASTSVGLHALVAVRRGVPDHSSIRRTLATTVMAASRGDHKTAQEALTALVDGDPDTIGALVPTTQQQVLATNRRTVGGDVAVVSPRGPAPRLDYPVLTVAEQRWTPRQRRGVDLLRHALFTDRASRILREEGFHDAHGTPPEPAGGAAAPPTAFSPTVQEFAGLDQDLESLTRPTRMLLLIDTSTSMGARTAGGADRIEVVTDAASSLLTLLGDQDTVGVRVFASRLAPGRDWTETAPLKTLNDSGSGQSHRARVEGLLDTLPDSLRPGGSSIHDAVLDAVVTLHDTYRPGASNVVVLLTDGRNQDPHSIDLTALTARLRALTSDPTPVQLIALGVGEEADLQALRRMTAATPGGRAHAATRPRVVEEVLFDALTTRP